MARPPSTPAELDAFQVELEVFQGPFDLLLQLIARRQLDITEIALAQVTDEFIAHMRRVPDLSTTTEFLVVAATLLEMKAAQLLPQTERDPGVDEDLSARDLLFSRLLQYRAFKGVAETIRERLSQQRLAVPRSVPLEPQFAQLLPELVWQTTPEQLAALALGVLAEKPRPDQAQHVNRPGASLEEELAIVEKRLRRGREATFADLVQDAANVAVVVTRFLAVLELYRRGDVQFTQPQELGPLTIRWEAPS
ncbi:ScpA family protein [Scrofimicrobium sp. R131]|uniref:Segregation and condensation protein A n=1 Tax=Scrofimicrobium appendicitidis TaxID=3079930 RepID=A0AAU7V6W3_9ACTO